MFSGRPLQITIAIPPTENLPYYSTFSEKCKDSDEKQEKTDKKYLSGSYSVPVSGSGVYRVSVDVKGGRDKISKTAEFEYDEKIYLKTVKSQYLEIGSETKVLITDGENYLLNELVLSLEDYKELYGVTEFYKFND